MYTKGVDWWSLGILCHELLVGQPPFYSGSMQRVYEKIVSAELKWPVLRVFPPCALIAHAQGSSGVVATVLLVWRGHTKSTTARSGPSSDLAMWLE